MHTVLMGLGVWLLLSIISGLALARVIRNASAEPPCSCKECRCG